MVCHHLDPSIPEDVAFAESRIRAETIAAEGKCTTPLFTIFPNIRFALKFLTLTLAFLRPK